MIRRSILPALHTHMLASEITLLVGPRQAGKTFLMQALKSELDQQGAKTIFLTLDYEEDRQFFVSQSALLGRLQLLLGRTKSYVFIDEIQRKTDAGLFLKGLYDMNLPYKFIVSGSGSLELKENIHESLAGRKRVFEINPLSFSEFVHFRTGYHFENKWQDFFEIEKHKGEELLQEYLTFGGYPRVVLAPTLDEKKSAMGELYQSYLDRDAKALLEVSRLDAYANLVKILSSQIGGLVNISELSNTIGISAPTIQNYLWYLEKTFIMHRLSPYFRNVRKEISRSPMYYFYDLGLRNYSLGLFGTLGEFGHLFENFVYGSIRACLAPPATIHFWRSRDSSEVDFVIDFGSHILPVEVKHRTLDKPIISRSFRNFINHYQPREAYLVHLGKEMEMAIGKTNVYFVPFYALGSRLAS